MGNIVFLGIKMGDIEGFQWHGHIGITYPDIFGASPIDAIRESFYSSMSKIVIAGCSGFLRRRNDTDWSS
jgi:hypothetical protein